MQFDFFLQFDCCGVEDDGYTKYLQNPNVTADEEFPKSCCVEDLGNLTCPGTIGAAVKAEKKNPQVFKKTVRKCSLLNC